MEDLTKKIEDLKIFESENSPNKPLKNNIKEKNNPSISSIKVNPEILNKGKILIIFSPFMV
jgi:hypothetical protein